MLWGTMNNAVLGMQASSSSMGVISQNISNVNTTGYKRTESLFKTTLSETHAGSNANIFGVKAVSRTNIAYQGSIVGSDSGTDLAINGRGFFMVAPPSVTTDGNTVTSSVPGSTDTTNPKSVLYTRDGAFTFVTGANQEQYFTVGGNYLLGWMADENGAVDSTGDLTPVYTLPETTMQGRTTTTASVLANLPYDSALTESDYDATSSITDPNGDAQDLTLHWTRLDATTWLVTPSVDSSVGSVTSDPVTVTMDAEGNITDPTDFTTQTVGIDWDDGTYGAAVTDTDETVNLSSTKPSMTLQKVYVEVYDSNYNAHTVTLGFERTGTDTWNMHVLPGDDYSGEDIAPIEVTFNGDGKMVSGGTNDLAFSWTDSDGLAGTATVALDTSGMTQYDSSSLSLKGVTTNGYGAGELESYKFNANGELIGSYSNGETRTLFKVPVATFVADNSLEPVSGNLFQRTQQAGALTVSPIEDVESGSSFSTGSLESSNVDIGGEFTTMIITQKAYSSNAQVFKTADEMTQTVRDLKA